MHGLTGGSWKRNRDQAMATEKNGPVGNRRIPVALWPTADHGHRASSRPSIQCRVDLVGESGWCPVDHSRHGHG
jgi:hypothetical protein